MQLPDSFDKMPAAVPASALTHVTLPDPLILNDLIFYVKKTLTSTELANFDFGLAFFNTDVSSEKQVIKNFIKLFSEVYVKAIKTSDHVSEEYADRILASTKQMFDALQQSFDASYNVITILNKENNFLDSKQIALIILGYAIGTIKKIYNN